jgi:pimeloyl-ACP methyl ester carboxylesterase
MRARLTAVLVVALAALCATAGTEAAPSLRVGSLALHRCGARVWCGSLSRPLDPTRPGAARIRIGFRWFPATVHDAGLPALVAVEGGPGFPSTGSSTEYHGIYGPLLRTRNLLLVDNRGTGSSALVECPRVQSFKGVTSGAAFPRLVGACGTALDRRYRPLHASGLFATAYATADLEAVLRALRLGRVDLYGDSYGTWFAQSFMSRYQASLHSVILDSAYPVRGLDPWYASSGEAARQGMDAVCARDPGCAAAAPGSATERLARLVDQVRRMPFAGATRDADGRTIGVTVEVRALVDLVQDAGTDPVVYRELDASVRAALAGDDVPLLRLVGQSRTFDHGNSSAGDFSNGLYFAVACTDYPQLFDMRSTPAQRRIQLAASLRRAPDAFAPFTPAEWVKMSAFSEAYASCLDWPRPVRRAAVVPAIAHEVPAIPAMAAPLPASIPILVLGGDIDSLTPLSDVKKFAPALGRSVRVVTLRNTVHVTSEGDTYLTAGAACARSVIRAFVSAPRRLASLDASCADRIPPIHTPGAYPATLSAAAPATLVSGPDPGPDARRAVTIAAGALADATMRWYYSSSARGPGLRGGDFTVSGGAPLRFRLSGVRFVSDATVDGPGTWDPPTGRVHGTLVVQPDGGAPVQVTVDWDQRTPVATATVGGASLSLPAP